ncbi:ornithine cyclodeaminase [Ponticoccus sp. SC2-23]|uniref:ornithine cyclodeaminase family protein n=1 Tax=Alexandriicola marinus TaxID=2081710 RepID=UPI000FD7E31D|nr:ornithine cyclodeaminase [Alexandriicola marinus]MBM1221883.1 ornithine cyclodeaminase [Ponticoccus sp. SC6-9]MBM1226234.1 ornithine cyclodeaminase [Ponticoccus sp. SC6-15]MBM1230830.1 ornithine cyclodeaminase [Ponticoccus sp. SC6-38]MBM1235329.1 ornithine cyclodeaminase [Ponticoccus sp. SC6-45]MBM1239852.1 ornithine cyclodeaminase [Ponticoccus sp. SC6-49]MBM1243996.1 ornithine cyclodeaminase [Ponticoccus sp. SC2-64]MBM1248853.1 ornithine cyclodeaminase [Ponticoccus sp. SC6-42]MBM1253507
MTAPFIPFDEGQQGLDWIALTEAIARGHELPEAKVEDVFIRRGDDTLLNRSAWIDGMGVAVKACMVCPGNPSEGRPMVNGAVNLFDDATGELSAILDFHLVTKWKTAGDSLLAALRLARPESRKILIVGAGTVARSLIEAYSAGFPDASFLVWNRTVARAEELAAAFDHVSVAENLPGAVAAADIVSCATMSSEPILKGEWLQPGQHVDLIGAFRADMREADDEAIRRGRLFVDARATTIGHIGEIAIPIAEGTITADDILADFRNPSAFCRNSESEITIFKNGGGAHLDLMVSRYILEVWNARWSGGSS